MKTEELKELLDSMDISWDKWDEFMFGNTYGIDEDGNALWYQNDIDQFISQQNRGSVFSAKRELE